MGGSFSAGKSKIDSDYASVIEQSGIRAGDQGFDVKATNDTTLTGGVIASTQAAIDNSRNRFTTGGELTTSDIHNRASYEATSTSVGSGMMPTSQGRLTPVGGFGIGRDSGDAASVTQAGISGIAGNKHARTGDKETGIANIFDAERVKEDIEAQVVITQTFSQQAAKAIGDYAGQQQKDAAELRRQADSESNPQRQQSLRDQANDIDAKWGPDGSLRLAAHAVVGGLTGGVQGAAGAAAGALTAPTVAQALAKADIAPELAQVLTAAASTAAGAAVGGATGAGMAFNLNPAITRFQSI